MSLDAYQAWNPNTGCGYDTAQGLASFLDPVDRALDHGCDVLCICHITLEELCRGTKLVDKIISQLLIHIQDDRIAASFTDIANTRSA